MSKVNKSTKNVKKEDNKKGKIKLIDDSLANESANELANESDNKTAHKTDKTDKTDNKEINKDEFLTDTTKAIFSPYINTTLVCPVMLFPNQMDNKMYLHIKDNLVNKLGGRCYKNFGFICKIYKIDEISDGVIEAEDPTCSAKLTVKFACKLCNPIKNKEIIFKIDRMNKTLIGGINGPLQVIITPDKINKEKFYPDNNRNIRIRGTSDVLRPDIYIKVMVLSSQFSDYEKHILVIGFLNDIATEEEYKQYLLQTSEEH